MSQKLQKIKELNQKAWDLCKKDGPQALELALKVQTMLAKCAEAGAVDKFECLRTQTYCLDMLSKPAEALPIGLDANTLAEQIGDKSMIGSIQGILGRIYWHIDDFPTAMSYYLNGLNLVQTESHPDLEISLMNGLGMVQYGLENYPGSLKSFKACLELAEKNDIIGIADANNNIAYVLHILGLDPEALQYGLAALALFNQIGTYVGKLHTLHTLGAIYISLGNNKQAMKFLEEGLELSRQNNSQLLELSYIIEISRIHQIQGQRDIAENEIVKALATAKAINSLTNISLTHERLVEIYKEKRDYETALEHLEAYLETYKKIFNDKSDQRLKNLEILHKVELTRKQTELYRELAGTDSLTGLCNRRHFYELAENALLQAIVDKEHLMIIMLDIDHFKIVNDTYGHKVGDEVLAEVAARIKKSLRQGDIAGRYGGEEFVILVTNALEGNCFNIAERIRQTISQQQIVRVGQTNIGVTVSLGLVCFDPEKSCSLEDLINCADHAMYLAKNQGRNRVVIWIEDQPILNVEPAQL
jgi:diguanylate cyclase (GGDEF)-like protein